MKRGTLVSFAALASLCLAYFNAGAEKSGVAEKIAHGQINWSDCEITVTGSAAPSARASNAAEARLGAERAAKLAAWRNILEAVKGVKVTADSTVGSSMKAEPQIRSRVEGVVRGFKVLDTKYYSDGGVDVIVSMPLDGALITSLVPERIPAEVPSGGKLTYTGLIVDASGKSLSPAMAPRLLSSDNKELYSINMVKDDALMNHGVVGYVKTLNEAKADARIGDKPLVVKANSITGSGRTDVVLAEDDAANLAAPGTDFGFLSEGRVIFVVN